VWWIVFNVVDLYIGLILLDGLMPSIPAEKLHRATKAKKVIVVLLPGQR
jgi:hypothetical protein